VLPLELLILLPLALVDRLDQEVRLQELLILQVATEVIQYLAQSHRLAAVVAAQEIQGQTHPVKMAGQVVVLVVAMLVLLRRVMATLHQYLLVRAIMEVQIVPVGLLKLLVVVAVQAKLEIQMVKAMVVMELPLLYLGLLPLMLVVEVVVIIKVVAIQAGMAGVVMEVLDLLEMLELQTQAAVAVAEIILVRGILLMQAVQASSLSKLTNKTYDRKNLSFVRHQHGNAFVTPWC
jgi:hypothetical protein